MKCKSKGSKKAVKSKGKEKVVRRWLNGTEINT